MAEEMLSVILEEIKMLRMENQEMRKKLDESTKSCVKCVLSYMISNPRISLGYYYPKFRSLEKSVPLRLQGLTISENMIRVDYQTYKFDNESKRIEGFDQYYPISVFASENVPDKNIIDAVLKSTFILFAGRQDFRVDNFWSKIKIPFELNICAGTVVVAPKKGKHAKNVIHAVSIADAVSIEELNEVADLNYDWITHVKQMEFLTTADHNFMDYFQIFRIKSKVIYFDRETILCEDLILNWCDDFDLVYYIGYKLIVAINQLREDATIDRIFNSPRLANYGFVRQSEKVLCHRPENADFEIRLTVRDRYDDDDDDHHHHYAKALRNKDLSRMFESNGEFNQCLYIENVRSSQ